MRENIIQPSILRTTKEKIYLAISLLVSVLYYVWTIQAIKIGTISSLIGPLIVLFLIALSVFAHLLSMASIRINSVKVGPNQFREIWEAVSKISRTMGLKKVPDLYIMQAGGELNAFATRLITRRILVIFSDLAEALIEDGDQSQLDAVVSHELAHDALNHTHFYNWFLWPSDIIPFLGSGLSRAREYSCDRVMKAIIGDQEACQRALVKLAIGKELGNSVNIAEYTSQTSTETGFFVWLSEKLCTHPHLPKRILAIKQIP